MTTKEFVDTLDGTDETYRKLLLFLHEFLKGYCPDDPDRANARYHANGNGYFWLPCELCGEWYGGHEVPKDLNAARVMLDSCRGIGGCPNPTCIEESKRIAKLYPNGIENP